MFYSYNCKEEFQIHDDLLKASYTVGRISESTMEHYLVQVRVTGLCRLRQTFPLLVDNVLLF